jgi:RimJ/RimL family protein N-acetyltransferase
MNTKVYKILRQQKFVSNSYEIIPIRDIDKFDIMRWRNEQMYHLRQNEILNESKQTTYFNTVVAQAFEQDCPAQLLFSFIQDCRCIGYGGLVHIDWVNKNAEISFIMDTSLEHGFFKIHWSNFLKCIEQLAFYELNLDKIFTYAYDVRPQLFEVLEESEFCEESKLIEHCRISGSYKDVRIHTKFGFELRPATIYDTDLTYSYASDEAVRLYSFNRKKITRKEHENWFHAKLKDINCYYLIFVKNKKPVGSIRLDIDSNGLATISYLIDSSLHGLGFGKLILIRALDYIVSNNLPITHVSGEVKKINVASVRIFESLKFNVMGVYGQNIKFIKKINMDYED